MRECKEDGPAKILLNDRDKQKDILKHFQDAEMNIEDTCREIVQDEVLLPKFAFEIRKQDPDNIYTSLFVLPYLKNKLL